MATNRKNLVITGAELLFTNFSGRESQYNRAGSRNFCVYIDDPDLAKHLEDQGWNIKEEYTEETDITRKYMQANVSYAYKEPTVVLVTRNDQDEIVSSVKLTEKTIGQLDSLDIAFADMTLYPFPWEKGGRSGIKGYLNKMFVNVYQEDYLEKYGDLNLDDDDIPFYVDD